MDFVNKMTGGSSNNNNNNNQGNNANEQSQNQQQSSGSSSGGGGGGGFLSGIGDKLNSAAGGGRESEKNEDYLDKGTFSIYKKKSHIPFSFPQRRSGSAS